MNLAAADGNYVLIGSMGGQPKNPIWVYNLRADPDIQSDYPGMISSAAIASVAVSENRVQARGHFSQRLTLLVSQVIPVATDLGLADLE